MGQRPRAHYHVDGEPLGERKVWLQDDYVKFIRLSQWLLDGTGAGVHGYISNHGYLDNPTFRGMRWSLMQSFRRIRVLHLHGNLKKKEVPPEGGRDVNVFDIQQGVAIGLFAKAAAASKCVGHADLWGEREQKYRWLWEHDSADTEWVQLEPGPPFQLFEPFDDAGTGAYYGWPAINEVMAVNVTGIVTARDGFVIDFDREALRGRIADLRSKSLSDDAIRKKYFVGKGSKKYPPRGLPRMEAACRPGRRFVKTISGMSGTRLCCIARSTSGRCTTSRGWWTGLGLKPCRICSQEKMLVNRHERGQTKLTSGVQRISSRRRAIIQHHKTCSAYDSQLRSFRSIPLSRSRQGRRSRCSAAGPKGKDGRTPNLDSGFVEQMADATELRFVSDGRCDLRKTFGPEDVLAYIYAVFHCRNTAPV